MSKKSAVAEAEKASGEAKPERRETMTAKPDVKTVVQHLELDKIKPNPWQIERPDDPQAFEELAESILANTMLETPVARERGEIVELGSGHRRYDVHRRLVEKGHTEFARMRLRIVELTDSQMADIVIQENKRRLDLTPIAEAKFYRRYMKEFIVTQTELAKRVGCSQGEISNTLRLLELPDQAQGMIISREITARHGRELLRVAEYPKVLNASVAALKKEPMAVEDLSAQIDRTLLEGARPLGDDYPRPIFDVSGCQKCPDRMMLQRWARETKRPYCIKSKCWDAKQAEAVAAKEKAALEKLEGQGVGSLHDKLDSGTYESLQDYNLRQVDKPEECESCERRHFLKDGHEHRPICVDLKCFRAKKAKKTKEDNERIRQERQRQTDRIEAAVAKVDPAGRLSSLMALEVLLRLGWSDVRSWFPKAYSLPEKENAPILDRLPTVLKGKSDEELRAMVPRVAMEVLRQNYGSHPDRLFHYLRELEGGPSEVELKLEDGKKEKKQLSDIYLVKEPGQVNKDKPGRYFAYFITDGATGSIPITEESLNELVALGIKKEVDWRG